MKTTNNRALAEVAMIVSLLVVINLTISRFFIVPITGMPYLTLEFLFLPLIVYKWGVKYGLLASALHLIVMSMFNSFYFLPIDNVWLILLDFILEYPISAMLVILSGLFRKKAKEKDKVSFVSGILLFGFGKFLLHGLCGIIFWRGITIVGDNNVSLLAAVIFSFFFYSIVYLIDAIISSVIGLILYDRIDKIMEM